MTHERYCELVQLGDNTLKFKENLDERIEEWPYSWHPLPRQLSYRLENFSSDTKEYWQTRAVTAALRAWRLRIDRLSFRRERNTTAHVDIVVKFGDLESFGGRKGVLARCYYPGQGELSGDCEINDYWNWVPGVHLASLSRPPLVPILIHEFGHGLGLTHDNYDMSDIMYPSFNLGEKKNRIGKRSIERMQLRYGKRNISAWKLAWFLRYRDRGGDFR
ncbi:MAG: matrixin family metalloprotease [Thaumarchaeota archaeon]|nr:matrixin family metalloprotease [Nitrososphaerota archaeon]